ncbi:unnamed protein product, partial [Ectocarpus sp. 12 AP-2014]
KWYVDEIINPYMILLSGEGNPMHKSCLFMNSFFYTKFKAEKDAHLANASAKERHVLVKRFTKNKVSTGPVKIFVPVNVGRSHWIMIMIDVKSKRVVSMDSLNSPNDGVRNDMIDWIEQEHRSRRRKFDRREWTSSAKKVPQQTNGWDCGPFALMFAAFVSNDKKLNFNQEDVPKMRNRIAWSILNRQL